MSSMRGCQRVKKWSKENNGKLGSFVKRFKSGFFVRPYIMEGLKVSPPKVSSRVPRGYLNHISFPEDRFFKAFRKRIPLLKLQTARLPDGVAPLAWRLARASVRYVDQKQLSDDQAMEQVMIDFAGEIADYEREYGLRREEVWGERNFSYKLQQLQLLKKNVTDSNSLPIRAEDRLNQAAGAQPIRDRYRTSYPREVMRRVRKEFKMARDPQSFDDRSPPLDQDALRRSLRPRVWDNREEERAMRELVFHITEAPERDLIEGRVLPELPSHLRALANDYNAMLKKGDV